MHHLMYFIPFLLMSSVVFSVAFSRKPSGKKGTHIRVGIKYFCHFSVIQAVLSFLLIILLEHNSSCYGSRRTKQWLRLSGNTSMLKVTSGLCSLEARIIKTKQWCEMLPCLEGEGCDLLINKSGWTCTQPGGRIKTTTLLQYYRM
uniref:TAFA chemokine like family member 5 n=1 Tax=Phasianus colchicus TaxID=9054 RepID=A0A669NXB4_PHACC